MSTPEATIPTEAPEADGIADLGNGQIRFRADGKDYIIPKLPPSGVAALWMEAERIVRESRPGPVEAILPELELLRQFPHLQEKLVLKAYERKSKGAADVMDARDVETWLNSMEGLAFTFSVLFKPTYPELTPEDILKIVMVCGAGKAVKVLDLASQDALAAINKARA